MKRVLFIALVVMGAIAFIGWHDALLLHGLGQACGDGCHVRRLEGGELLIVPDKHCAPMPPAGPRLERF